MQLYLDEDREKEFCDNIIDNDYSNNNLDLLLMPKLTSFFPSTKALITLATQKHLSIRKADQQIIQGTQRRR